MIWHRINVQCLFDAMSFFFCFLFCHIIFRVLSIAGNFVPLRDYDIGAADHDAMMGQVNKWRMGAILVTLFVQRGERAHTSGILKEIAEWKFVTRAHTHTQTHTHKQKNRLRMGRSPGPNSLHSILTGT